MINMEDKELQKKIISYRILEARLQGLLKQRDLIASKILEIKSTIESIKEIEKNGNKVLFPLGSEAYTIGEVKEKNKILVEIGANIVLEKNFEDSKKILEKRKSELERALQEIQKEIILSEKSLENLAEDIEKFSK